MDKDRIEGRLLGLKKPTGDGTHVVDAVGLSISTQIGVTDGADAILLLHQQADTEERKAKEEHQDKNQPAF